MKNISPAFKAHLQQEVTTLSTCWKVTRVDGLIFGFTDCATNLIFENIIYSASTGQNSSNIKTTSALNVDNLDVQGNLGGIPTSFTDVIDAPYLTEEDIRNGLWDLASIEIFMVNYNDLSMGKLVLRSGTIGEIKTGRTQFTAELRGMTQPLQQQIGRIFTPSCSVNLGSPKCGIDLSLFTFSGSVTSTINQHSWIDTSLNQTNSPTPAKTITNIAAGSTTVLECPAHGFTGGDSITISGITGAMAGLNGLTTLVGLIDVNNISIDYDTSVFLFAVPGTSPQEYQNSSYSNNFVATYTGTWNTSGGSYIGGGVITSSVDSEYFQGGLVTWTSGQNKNLSMEVKNYNPNYVFLAQRMILPIAVGDTYTISAGCDKRASTCNDRYDNIINFRGFNLIPGNDKMQSGQ